MCNQNIISNKFDLILTTMLSSYLSAAYTVEKTVYTAAVAGGDDLKR